MWVLVLVAALGAESAHASGPPLPGSRLRLGQSLAAVDSALGTRGAPADSTGRAERRTTTRFFGLVAQATLGFSSEGLATASFEVTDASPHSVDYIADQMRRAGYAGGCVERAGRVCNWDGPARVQIVAKGAHVTARVRATDARDDDEEAPDVTDANLGLPSNLVIPDAMRQMLLRQHAALKAAGGDSAASAKRAVPAATAGAAAPRDTGRVSAGTAAAAPSAGSTAAPTTTSGSPTAVPAAPSATPATIAAGSAAAPRAAPPSASGAAWVPTLRDTLRMPTASDPNPRVGPYPVPVMAEPRSMVAYPEQARNAGVQGLVRVLAHVDTAGVVTEASLIGGIAELNAEALRAARAQRFVPYRFGGVVYAFYVIVPYRFTIH